MKGYYKLLKRWGRGGALDNCLVVLCGHHCFAGLGCPCSASGAQSKDKDRPDSSARERKEKEDPLTDAFDDASIAAVKDINSVVSLCPQLCTGLVCP